MEAGKRFIEKIFHFLQDPSKYDNLIRWEYVPPFFSPPLFPVNNSP